MNPPKISKPLLGWFAWYSRRYLRRHFNSLRVARGSEFTAPDSLPLVIYSNHAAWWDPLAGLLLSRGFFPQRNTFVPMEAKALRRYGFFKKLGAFGVEAGTQSGARQFLQTSRAVLRSPGSALWLTPQSRFADVRERPVRFKAGIGHLPSLAPQILFQPVAIEYVFWEERLPEILVRFGDPVRTHPEDARMKPSDWTHFLADRLRVTQETLAQQAQQRQPEDFRCLLSGRAGVGGIYDSWRSLKARLTGQKLQLNHGNL
jgi:1-acyl-sn-glycerol-3-phosphate acyltransferase